MPRINSITILVTLSVCGLLLSGLDSAVRAEVVADDGAREYKIKAAFLYNFVKFTEWPENRFEDSSVPLRICVLGENPFGEQIYSIAGKNVRGRQLAISSLSKVEETDPCHLLFIGESEVERLPVILAELSERPVLTVSDMKGFATAGGMINLRTVDNKIRFTININATRTVALRLSSRVLRLADIVGRVSAENAKSGVHTR